MIGNDDMGTSSTPGGVWCAPKQSGPVTGVGVGLRSHFLEGLALRGQDEALRGQDEAIWAAVGRAAS